MIEHWHFHSEIFPDGLCDTYLHDTLFKCSTTKLVSKINLRYFYPFPLYSHGHPKKWKLGSTLVTSLQCNSQCYDQVLILIFLKYFLPLIDTYYIHFKFRLHSALTVLFQQRPNKEGHSDYIHPSYWNKNNLPHLLLKSLQLFFITHRIILQCSPLFTR